MHFELTYIYHDCFLLDTEKAVVVFDYWKDPLSGGKKDFPPMLEMINPDKPVYFIVSHHHKDHFSRRIFLWSDRFPEARYILSKDTFKAVKFMFRDGTTYSGPAPDINSVTVLEPGQSYEDSRLRIEAFGSTDIGNSYLVETEGKKFFHAGDLNAWIWKDESTEKEVNEALKNYNDILDILYQRHPVIDLAMFPVDSRLGTEYYEGARIFVRKFDVGIFVPMHFELVVDDEDKRKRNMDAGRFELYSNPTRGEYIHLASSRSKLRKNFGKP